MMFAMALMLFAPWIAAQEVKHFFPKMVAKAKPYFTAIEIILLFLLVR